MSRTKSERMPSMTRRLECRHPNRRYIARRKERNIMALVRWQRPSLLSRMEQFFEDAFGEEEVGGLTLGAWNPRVNMYEKGDNIVVDAELPGIKKEDIDVRVE